VVKVAKIPVTIKGNTADRGVPKSSGRAAGDLGGKRAGSRWKSGQSGNPLGRPVGSRNRTHLRLEKILLDDAERVLQRVIRAALAGDVPAAKLILDRALPKRVCRPLENVTLPEIGTIPDACAAMGIITSAAIQGVITTAEALDLSHVVENFRKIIETTEFEQRLALLEQQASEQP
jgi:hypothetical protein